VLAHRSSDTLYAYSDGSLAESQRAGVDAHLLACAACRQTVQEIQRLDLVLQDFPPVPSVPFPRFWSKLDARLPHRAEKRFEFFRPRQLAAGFALAIVTSLVGLVALASDATMPDSPLYSVKHLRQDAQLWLSSGRERTRFELALSVQRVHEAKIMVQRRRDDLAVASLKDLKALLADAAPRLETTPGTQPDAADVSAIDQIKTDLKEIDAANLEPDGSTPPEIAAVAGAIDAAQAAVTSIDTTVAASPPVVDAPSASPVIPSAETPPAPTPSEPPSPEPTIAPSEPASPPSEPASSPLSETPPADVTPAANP
jgi:hypothetical protein